MTSWQLKEREAWQAHAAGLNRVKQKQYGWMVDLPNPAKSYDVIVVANGQGGALVERETLELCSVWSLGGGLLPRISRAAVEMGAEWLSCYDAGLVRMYEECGWVVTQRHPFDPLQAPADWPGNLCQNRLCSNGYLSACDCRSSAMTPDYVVMRR